MPQMNPMNWLLLLLFFTLVLVATTVKLSFLPQLTAGSQSAEGQETGSQVSTFKVI